MSIKGIDAQIMIMRSAELARETSNQQKKRELTQDYMNIQVAEFERQKKQMVQKANESEKLRLQTDKDGGGEKAASYRQESDDDKGEDTQEELQVAPDPSDKHVIDIKI